jgi:GNAT superfamily N-acetyltransferase
VDSPTLRPAISDDAEAVAQLHIENWRNTYRGIMPDWYLDGSITEDRMILWKNRLSALANEQQYVVIAELSRKIVGFACILLDKEPQWGACLDNLHVLPQLRRSGIGRALFSQVTKWVLTTRPGWPIHLWVFESNINARNFYNSLGGNIILVKDKQVLEGVWVHSCLYLWKDLNALQHRLYGDSSDVSYSIS